MSDPNPFENMSDAQLKTAMTQLSSAAARPNAHPAYFNNIRQWSTSVTPPPMNGRTNPRRTRPPRGSSLAPTPQPQASTSTYVQPIIAPAAPQTPVRPPVAPPPLPQYGPPAQTPLPTQPQAMYSTYASRLRTGTTLLMQPIFNAPSTAAVTTRSSRRGGVVNYVDPGSGDEFPDAGAIESDDSDFVASGGTRTALRTARLSSRAPIGAGVFRAGSSTPTIQVHAQPKPESPRKDELDKSYLGQIPPAHFITAKPMAPTRHDYFPQDAMENQARKPSSLVPIRVEFETDTHRIRDCFVWNLHEGLIRPETFARAFCMDLDLPLNPWADTIANQIRAQLEDHEGVASVDLGADYYLMMDNQEGQGVEEVPECRVVLSIDVQIGTYHLVDHIEWDLLSPLTPEGFAMTLCSDLGLAGEAIPLIAHAIHEELIKHKRDAIEWGVIGAETAEEPTDKPRDKSGLSLLKDKTGLGLGWGRTPKEGRGPKALRSVWKDWPEAEEFRTRFEVLSAEEVERREVERERAIVSGERLQNSSPKRLPGEGDSFTVSFSFRFTLLVRS
ncbi:unnamed protein product [Somion occarium]|uniref:SNF5-domain-containing protein n=1 Tax=Somion occarium TaxID=3059160 RepID=A0ABP1DX64_9APHY